MNGELLELLAAALREMIEAAEEADRNHAQYTRAWLGVKSTWELATRPLAAIAEKTEVVNCIAQVPPMFGGGFVRFGHWHNSPPPPLSFEYFLKELVAGIQRQVENFRKVSAACRDAVEILRALEDALAPQAAMEKLSE